MGSLAERQLLAVGPHDLPSPFIVAPDLIRGSAFLLCGPRAKLAKPAPGDDRLGD
jgi:hypothetical protein